MTKEDLKQMGLSDEQVIAVWDVIGKDFVPRLKFNEKNEETKQLKLEKSEIEVQIADLKKANKNNIELSEQITNLQAEIKTKSEQYATELAQTKLNASIERGLLSAKVKNTKAVKALLDVENIKLEGDKLVGLSEQLEKIKENDAYLFDVQSVASGFVPTNNSDVNSNTLTKEQFNKMSYAEKTSLFAQNPTLYGELTK